MFQFQFTVRWSKCNSESLLALLGVLGENGPDLMMRCKTPLSFGKLKELQFSVQTLLIKFQKQIVKPTDSRRKVPFGFSRSQLRHFRRLSHALWQPLCSLQLQNIIKAFSVAFTVLCILKSSGNLLVLSIIQASALKWNILRPVNIELLALKNICQKFTSLRHRQSGRLNMERGGGKKKREMKPLLMLCIRVYLATIPKHF